MTAKSTSHVKVLLITIVAVVAIVATFVGVSPGARSARLADTRINEQYRFPRLITPTCDQIPSPAAMALWIEGMDTGIKAVGCDDDPPVARFDFRHVRPPGQSVEVDRAVWSLILGHPLRTVAEPRTLAYKIVLTHEDGSPQRITPTGSQFSFVIFEWWAPLALLAVLLVWGLIVYLGRHSALLRDVGQTDLPLERRTFSLAKTQFAWWFAIVFASFVFLWLVTGQLPSVSPQALALMGISGATTVVAVGITNGREVAPGSEGVFFHDILADAGGIAVQRLQMVVMTAALGIMFLIQVATELTMPEFDGSLLTLMGLSAGAYVGMKVPEDLSVKAGAAANGAGADPKSGYAPTP